MIDAYPLQWPEGWPRTQAGQRERARFSKGERRYSDSSNSSWVHHRELTIADGVSRVRQELDRIGVSSDDMILSTNAPTRLDGFPRSDARNPDDPGAAVYWRKKGANRVMAIDRYDRLADNLAAIAATLEALRAVERHGGARILDRAFTGFTALPSPARKKTWREVLGIGPEHVTLEQTRHVYRSLCMKRHPDRPGGSHDAMAELTAAMREAENELS